MISESTLHLLHSAIVEYDKLSGKDYLSACNASKKAPLQFYVFRIHPRNFWHLLGCEKDKSITLLFDIYEACKQKEDIRQYLNYTGAPSACKTKHTVFMALFDFVSKAKQIRICKTNGTPEYYVCKLISGDYRGFIGYDLYDGYSYLYFPKTTRDKKTVANNFNQMRIAFILSKPINESSYTTIEYCVSKKAFPELIKKLPEKYKYISPISEV